MTSFERQLGALNFRGPQERLHRDGVFDPTPDADGDAASSTRASERSVTVPTFDSDATEPHLQRKRCSDPNAFATSRPLWMVSLSAAARTAARLHFASLASVNSSSPSRPRILVSVVCGLNSFPAT